MPRTRPFDRNSRELGTLPFAPRYAPIRIAANPGDTLGSQLTERWNPLQHSMNTSVLLDEIWVPIDSYEGCYEVSNLGRVRSLDRYVHNRSGWPPAFKRGHLIKQSPTGGYPAVGLHREGLRPKRRAVHLMVLEAFVGARPSPDHVACHGDGNPFNNNVSNLRWDTRAANARDSIAHGTNRQRAKTHCPHGHEYTPENTEIYKGGRKCKTCLKARRATGRPSAAELMRGKTHCPYGHEYTPENTYTPPGRTTGRCCRTCRRIAGRIHEQRRRILHSAGATSTHNLSHPNAMKTRCKRGHLFDAANTYVMSTGSRACRACRRERSADKRG